MDTTPRQHSGSSQRSRSRRDRRVLGFMALLVLGGAVYALSTTSPELSMTPQPERSMSGVLPQLKFTKHGELTFISAKNTFLATVDIEIADTPEKRSLGMMYRNALGDRQGMLFIFPKEEYQSFWMKNTAVSLDMIFVSARNEIVTIHEKTTPYSPQSYTSTKAAQFVIEVNAGFAQAHGISVGDKVRWQRR